MISREARRPELLGPLAAALAFGAPLVWLWGFTVDDALITARVAAHIAAGLGHRFNSGGPPVDAVTPFGFAYLLAPISRGDPLRALYFAKWQGTLAGLGCAVWLGRTVARDGGSALRWPVLLVPLALSLPLAAWCVSGMETGLIVLLTTLSLSSGRWVPPLLGGVAAGLRPELIPWTLVLGFGRGVARRESPGQLALALGLAIGPAVLVAVLRLLLFGHPAPLAVWAKPSDLGHGLFYVLGALIWTGAPLLVLAPLAFRTLDGESRVVLTAFLAHCGSLVLVGGDWMALYRLFVPVLPALLLVASRLASSAPWWATLARLAPATGLSMLLFIDKSQATRGVLGQRLRLIQDGRSLLNGARHIAALDVGWVGTAAQGAEIVDLAGVTDEAVAHLPGGHTSKHLPSNFLARRRVDALVLLTERRPGDARPSPLWSRAVEGLVAREAADLGFEPVASLELFGTPSRYLVLRLRNVP